MKRIPSWMILTLALTACSAVTLVPAQTTPSATPTSMESSSPPRAGTARVDHQGMVVVEVTPLNLSSPGDTLEFNVSLDTHSVDLSMDLASLALLRNEAGLSVPARMWDAPNGGHHVSGMLTFPTKTVDGRSVLDGAGTLTISIVNLDVPLREFVWVLK